MIEAPTPANEPERLETLRKLLILDTPPEERFDKMTAFAASEFDVPIALVSLIDSDRQWFKSHFGLSICETPRRISFCAHALECQDVFLVHDALLDKRFHDNPLVVGEPYIRFYAGAPLIMPNGVIPGTFCIIDRVPRELDKVSLYILKALRDLTVEELLRRGEH